MYQEALFYSYSNGVAFCGHLNINGKFKYSEFFYNKILLLKLEENGNKIQRK
jgi:hypothetical protein